MGGGGAGSKGLNRSMSLGMVESQQVRGSFLYRTSAHESHGGEFYRRPRASEQQVSRIEG